MQEPHITESSRVHGPVADNSVLERGPGGLIGRELELATLRASVGDVAAGRGRSVWVQGEPGIGKTALLAAGLDQVDAAGCQLFQARADETSPMFPLRVLLDAMRVGPDATDPVRAEIVERLWGARETGLATPGDPVAAAAELLLILVNRLCATRPVVLVVDDVQWADETSLALWGRLGRAVGQLPLLLVAAARPVPRRQAIDRLRRDLADTDQLDVSLGPLDSEQVCTLVERLVSVPPGPGLRGLVGQAAGNPLYVRELVDAQARARGIHVQDGVAELVAGATAGPVSLTAAISGRLNFLSDDAARVLRMASLLGPEFRVDHLSALTGRAASELTLLVEESLAAGVLAESGSAFAFRHGLIHQTLYESTPAALRVALHQQAARSLAAAGVRAEAVATQLLAVPDAVDNWTVQWLVDSAPALITRAPQVAVDLLQRVRQSIEPVDPRRVGLDVHLIDAYARLGRYQEVDTLARPVLAEARDPEVVGRVTWVWGYALRFLGQYEQALEVTCQAVVEPPTTAKWQARLRALHASMLVTNARYAEAQTAAEQSEAAGQLAGDRVAIGWALFAASQVQEFFHLDQAAALTLLERAAAVLGDDPEATELRLLVLNNSATALWNLGRRTEGTHRLGQALALAERSGTPQRLASLRLFAGEIGFLDGRWDDALAELEAVADNGAAVTQILRRGLVSLIAVHRDDQAALATHLGDGDDAGIPPGNTVSADKLYVARALAAEREGRPERGLAILLGLLDPESTLGFSRISDCMWMIDTVRLALAVGDLTIATAAARACSAEAQRHPVPDAQASAEYCLGLLDADPARLLSAADSFHRLGYVLLRAAALDDAAFLLAQRGDVAAARATYGDAVGLYADLDAAWDIRRADARMRPLGIRRGVRSTRRLHTTGWEALTPTEIKVAALIAAGKSNPDISAELYLSRRTVEAHVSHILSKLECRSRLEVAVRAVAERRMVTDIG